VRRVLVTGAAGFLGSHLVERLLERGHRVVGADAFRDYYAPARKRRHLAAALAHPQFRLWEVELERLSPGEAPEVEGVFHLAGQPGVRNTPRATFADYVRDNLIATHALLAAYAGRRLEFFVYASSSSVYGHAARRPTPEGQRARPVSSYGITKHAGEALCRAHHETHGLPARVARLFTVYGPRQRPDMAVHRFLDAQRRGRALPLFGDGAQRRDFTYVDDAVRGLLAVAERGRPGRAYNLGGGAPRPLTDLFATLERLSGRPVRLARRPAPPGEVRDTAADIARARSELGWEPRMSLEAGLERQWEWLVGSPAARVTA
jgi:UDP-glucose 4-epimerase